MDLKEKLVSSFIAFENQVDIDSYVHDIRTEAIKNFESIGFPTKKNESWKYTSLKQVLDTDYSVFPSKNTALVYSKIEKYLIDDIDSYKIIFVDGIYSSHLSWKIKIISSMTKNSFAQNNNFKNILLQYCNSNEKLQKLHDEFAWSNYLTRKSK